MSRRDFLQPLEDPSPGMVRANADEIAEGLR